MDYLKMLNLQLFGGEGADGGGEGAQTGVGGEPSTESPVPGEARLRELGVPEAKLKERAYRRGAKQKATAGKADVEFVAQSAEQLPTAQSAEAVPTEARRLSWEEIVADPEYNRNLQLTLSERVKSEKRAEESLRTITPALELIARQYNLDPDNLDYKALNDAVSGDLTRYEDMALRLGVSSERARELDEEDRASERRRREESEALRKQQMDDYGRNVIRQADELKQDFPEFDLLKEMENPTFAAVTHPSVGMSVREAYYAIHHQELMEREAQRAEQNAVNRVTKSVQANRFRPRENGTSSRVASTNEFNYRNATPEERKAFKQYLHAAQARGEKVYPGTIQRK